MRTEFNELNKNSASLAEGAKLFELGKALQSAHEVLKCTLSIDESDPVKFLGVQCKFEHSIALMSGVIIVLSAVYKFAQSGTVTGI